MRKNGLFKWSVKVPECSKRAFGIFLCAGPCRGMKNLSENQAKAVRRGCGRFLRRKRKWVMDYGAV